LVAGARAWYFAPGKSDLVENLPAGQNLGSTIGFNNHGNMIGAGQQGSFLLLRVVR
jgi:hypothetical protein